MCPSLSGHYRLTNHYNPTLTKEEIQKTCDVLTEVALANYSGWQQ